MDTKADTKAIELGASIVNSGINWYWANAFPSHAKAAQFVEWLVSNGYEHRGIYPDGPPNMTWSVRYRSA